MRDTRPGRAARRSLATTVLLIGAVSTAGTSSMQIGTSPAEMSGVTVLPGAATVTLGSAITVTNSFWFPLMVSITNTTTGRVEHQAEVAAGGTTSWTVAGSVGDVLLTEVTEAGKQFDEHKHEIVPDADGEER